MLRALADLASTSGGVFTRAQALACGYTGRQVRLMVDSGLWAVLRHGVLADAQHLALADDQAKAVLDIAAARVTLSSPTVGSDRSAASAHGLPLLSPGRTVFLIGSAGLRRGTSKLPVVVRRGTVPSSHRTSINGVPITSLTRTLTDLSIALPLLDAVVVTDAALHRRLTTVEDLTSVAGDTGTLPSLMQLLPRCDGRSESPLESISRVRLAEQGIESPELQHEVRDETGRLIGRVDFWWRRWRVGGEADGLVKYEIPDDLRREKLRQEALEQAGCPLVRWSYAEIFEEPAAVAARLRASFAASERRGHGTLHDTP